MIGLPYLYKCTFVGIGIVTLDAILEEEVLDLKYRFRWFSVTHSEQNHIHATLIMMAQVDNQIVTCHHGQNNV